MKKFLTSLLLAAVSLTAQAKENIVVASSYPASHSGHSALLKVLDHASQQQNKYNFVLESHPGAQGLIALNYAKAGGENRLTLVAAGVVDVFETGKAQESDFAPVYAFGDACWAVVTNWPADETQGIKSIKPPAGARELVLGVVGVGSVGHMTGLEVAGAIKQKPLTVVFKSGNEAFLNLAAGNGVNLTVESVTVVQNMKIKSPDLRIVATTCNDRNPLAAHIPTLSEQGLGHIPPVINIVLAARSMPVEKRKEIETLLNQATVAVGAKTIFEMSQFRPAVFQNLTAQQYYDRRVGQIKALRKKYAKELAEGAAK